MSPRSPKVETTGPQFVRAGLFAVAMHVGGDPEDRWHWHQFRAKSYDDARSKAPEAFRQLAHECVSRMQDSIRVRGLLVDALLARYPHAPYIKPGSEG